MDVVATGSINAGQVMGGEFSTNLFAQLPQALPEELVDVLVDRPRVRIERIVSTGQSSPPDQWYDQPEHEWVVLLKGEAELDWGANQQPTRMRPGDHVLIPAHRKHRMHWTSPAEPTVWLAIFFS